MSKPKVTRLADLARKYLEAEDKAFQTKSPADCGRWITLRARLIAELDWIQRQRAEALKRINPPFNL